MHQDEGSGEAFDHMHCACEWWLPHLPPFLGVAPGEHILLDEWSCMFQHVVRLF